MVSIWLEFSVDIGAVQELVLKQPFAKPIIRTDNARRCIQPRLCTPEKPPRDGSSTRNVFWTLLHTRSPDSRSLYFSQPLQLRASPRAPPVPARLNYKQGVRALFHWRAESTRSSVLGSVARVCVRWMLHRYKTGPTPLRVKKRPPLSWGSIERLRGPSTNLISAWRTHLCVPRRHFCRRTAC
jgi:hypothetical protein